MHRLLHSLRSISKAFGYSFVIFAALLLAGAVAAWTGPSAAPPSGNALAPLNVSSSAQVKSGTIGTLNYLNSHFGVILDQLSTAPAFTGDTTAGNLYNVGGTLYWKGSPVGGGGTIGGTGATNYVTKFTSPSTIGNSSIYDNGTNVGIGTTSPSPTSLFTVANSSGSAVQSIYGADNAQTGINIGVSLYNRWLLYRESNSASRSFNIFQDHTAVGGTAGTVLSISTNGNIGIGTTPDSNFKLDILSDATAGDVYLGGWDVNPDYNALILNGRTGLGNYNFLTSLVDSTLYINRPSGGSIRFSENNTEQMIIASGGNVSIGTLCLGGVCRSAWPSGGSSIDLGEAATFEAGAGLTSKSFECPAGTTVYKIDFIYWGNAQKAHVWCR